MEKFYCLNFYYAHEDQYNYYFTTRENAVKFLGFEPLDLAKEAYERYEKFDTLYYPKGVPAIQYKYEEKEEFYKDIIEKYEKLLNPILKKDTYIDQIVQDCIKPDESILNIYEIPFSDNMVEFDNNKGANNG